VTEGTGRARIRRLTTALSAVLVLIALPAATSPAATVGVSSAAAGTLLAHWPLDSGAPCNDNTATLQDATGRYPLTTQKTCNVNGRVRQALQFPGDAFFDGGIRPERLTVSLWARAGGSPGVSKYLLAQGSGLCKPAAYGMYTSFAGDANAGGLYFYVTNGGAAYHAPGLKPNQIWDGSWHMVTGTFDGSRARLYLDAFEVGNGVAVPGPIDYAQTNKRFVLGSYGRLGSTGCIKTGMYYVGQIDEPRIYDGALDQVEIRKIYDDDVSGSNPPVGDFGSAEPIVRTTDVDQITESGARVTGTIDNRETVQATPYQVEYGTTTAFGQKTALQSLPATAAAAYLNQVAVTLSGLAPDTDYVARLVSPWSKTPGASFAFHTAGRAKPRTTITLDPAEPQAAGLYEGGVNVSVTATGRKPLETRCTLDRPKAPTSFGDLPSSCKFMPSGRVANPGKHTVYAATRDEAGNIEAPLASRSFTISITPETTITSGASGETWRPNNLFYFSSSVLPATFECRLDGGSFKPCSSPFETGVLGSGPHTFAVRAIAPGGAVDPTPAEGTFTIAFATSAQAECQVAIQTPMIKDSRWLTYPRPGSKVGCQIGTLGAGGCPALVACVVKKQTCPRGARCTITTRAAWFDADRLYTWGVLALATTGTTLYPLDWLLFPTWGLGRGYDQLTLSQYNPSDSWMRPEATGPGVEAAPWAVCWAGEMSLSRAGDRCFVGASQQVLGDGRPLLSACNWIVPEFYDHSILWSADGNMPTYGPDSVRRIECSAEWRVESAPELAAVAAGQQVDVITFMAGILLGQATIDGATTADRTTASIGAADAGEAKPRIAAVRKVVRKGGMVRIQLKLNPAANHLLAKKKQLTIKLRLTFKAKGRKQVVRTQRLTITAPSSRPAGNQQ
jgi:concanavalin A-like lectin/glucanase superfamily protein